MWATEWFMKAQIEQLEKENKSLKEQIEKRQEEVERFKQNAMEDMRIQTELEQENKNLKLIQETNEKQIKNDIKERDELREKIETLELWLDNKEKLNEEYRVELDKYKKYYDRDKEELMESCYALAKENDELKNKRIFSSAEYDLITLTSTTPQYELRKK